MAVARVKTWAALEVLTADDLNAEFNNILNNGEDLGWPATKAKDLDGKELILDADGNTSITADTDDQIDFKVGGTDVLVITSSTMKFKGSPLMTKRGLDRFGLTALPTRVSTLEHRVSEISGNATLAAQVFNF